MDKTHKDLRILGAAANKCAEANSTLQLSTLFEYYLTCEISSFYSQGWRICGPPDIAGHQFSSAPASVVPLWTEIFKRQKPTNTNPFDSGLAPINHGQGLMLQSIDAKDHL